MKKSNQLDIYALDNIIKYLNNIKKCFEQNNITNANNLKNDEIAQAACTQFITNIYESKDKLKSETYNKLTELNKIKLESARHIASHFYDKVEFSAIFAICKQLTKPVIFSELYNILAEIENIENSETEVTIDDSSN